VQHDVELQGTLVVVGRDPTCDLVLNDVKCSRKHAVFEAGPQGIAVRDTGSANGVYVNGAKIERANLVEGDLVRVGEVSLTVLPDQISGTVVMGPEDMADLSDAPDGRKQTGRRPIPPGVRAPAPPPATPAVRPPPPPPRVAAAPPPPRPEPSFTPVPLASRPARLDADPIPRALTVTVLASLWFLGAPIYAISGLVAAYIGRDAGLLAALPAVLGFGIALFCAVVGYGLWARSSWGRWLQLTLAVLGLCSPAILTCILILIYLMRAEVQIQFSGRRFFRDLSPAEARILRESGAEAAFSLSILGSLLVTGLLVGLLAYFAGPWRRPQADALAVQRLRTVASAQQAFRSGTCEGYADLDGLIHPASVIPRYSAAGPAFLSSRYALGEEAGYRFDLQVDEPLPASEGCPARSYRRFAYAALPLSGAGRHYVVGPDRVVRSAFGRPAGPEDPPTSLE
jgi:hypothetical protein